LRHVEAVPRDERENIQEFIEKEFPVTSRNAKHVRHAMINAYVILMTKTEECPERDMAERHLLSAMVLAFEAIKVHRGAF
jgi:hypothetical protein